ncbi:MAG: helix-turn-helix domain-containing protein [Wenzhouxiangellaceae bacterium]
MHVNHVRLRELRIARQWSQEQLATLSGLNLRTIQRLESGARISQESLRALSAVFEVSAESLLANEPEPSEFALQAMRECVRRGLDFTGITTRREFWWFLLAVVMFLGLVQILSQHWGKLPLQLASILALLPWIAACTRRLRDAGLSPWWQLISLVPVGGIIVLLYLLTYPTRAIDSSVARTV